mgnify:CR=1 FL=1
MAVLFLQFFNRVADRWLSEEKLFCGRSHAEIFGCDMKDPELRKAIDNIHKKYLCDK